MWYEWRMKLTEGLREVLVSHAEGLKNDSSSLAEQEAVLQDALPDLMKQHEQLQEECSELQHRAEELADCDQDELAQARQQLVAVDQEVRAKKERLAALKEQSSSLDKSIETAQDAKVENLQAIREAQRVREEFRGWSTSEVNKLKGWIFLLNYSCSPLTNVSQRPSQRARSRTRLVNHRRFLHPPHNGLPIPTRAVLRRLRLLVSSITLQHHPTPPKQTNQPHLHR